ncbi:MAG: ROK family protein [Acidimicrobiia bacterium]|nr:ROK family protein [Acidimicrobiia bacterium]
MNPGPIPLQSPLPSLIHDGREIVDMRRYLGLDLGGTSIKSIILDVDGDQPTTTGFRSTPAEADGGPTHVIDRIVAIGRDIGDEFGPFHGVGLGVPGLFDADTGTIELFPNLPGPWKGQPIRDAVAEGLVSDVAIINDARAFSLAESHLGAGKGCTTVVCLTLGTGVGGGVVIGGRVHLGAWGVAGEIGHQIVQPDGPVCGCGNRGCVEVLAQAETLARLAGKESAEAVYRAAREGEERSRQAIETTAHWLGIGLANTVAVLGPDRIIIGGGILDAGDLALDPIRRVVRERVTLVPPGEIEVVAAELGPTAGAVGAALAAHQSSSTTA